MRNGLALYPRRSSRLLRRLRSIALFAPLLTIAHPSLSQEITSPQSVQNSGRGQGTAETSPVKSAQKDTWTKVSGRSPSSAFRPISPNLAAYPGSVSAQNLLPQAQQGATESDTAWQRQASGSQDSSFGVRQTAFMQGSEISMPSFDSPAATTPPRRDIGAATPSTSPVPPSTPPSLQSNPTAVQSVPPLASPTRDPRYQNNPATITRGQTAPPAPSDAAAIPSPQLQNQWATLGNSPMVSPPPAYQTGFWGCGPAVMPVSNYPYRVVPATTMPNAPLAVAATSSPGPKPLFTLGQENYNVQLGQGIIGQPKAYVPGQYFRNFLRYLSP